MLYFYFYLIFVLKLINFIFLFILNQIIWVEQSKVHNICVGPVNFNASQVFHGHFHNAGALNLLFLRILNFIGEVKNISIVFVVVQKSQRLIQNIEFDDLVLNIHFHQFAYFLPRLVVEEAQKFVLDVLVISLQLNAPYVFDSAQVFLELDQKPVAHENATIVRSHNFGNASRGFYKLLKDDKFWYLQKQLIVFPDQLDGLPQIRFFFLLVD